MLLKLTSCKCNCDANNQCIDVDFIGSQITDDNSFRSQQKLHARKNQDQPSTNTSNLGCDFRWELSEVSSTLIHLRPKSRALPKHCHNLCLQISCRDTKFEPNTENKQQVWFQELKRIIFSNNLVRQNKTCLSDIGEKKVTEQVNTTSPPESPKPKLPPRKPRSHSDNTPKPDEYAKQVKDSAVSYYKQFGDSNKAQDFVKSYIEADKLRQQQKDFRYTVSDKSAKYVILIFYLTLL